MTPADEATLEALAAGRFRVERDGTIWRCSTPTRTGRLRTIEPQRADLLHSGNRYVKVRVGRRHNVEAHRMVWLALRGPIPDGFEVNHKNLNRSDNRIDNLELLTHVENVRHAVDAGAVPRLLGERSARHVLTDAAIIDIRRRATAGEPPLNIASIHGVSRSCIYHVLHRRVWSHVSDRENV